MARAALHLGIRELADACGISTATVTRLEGGGDTRVSTMRKIEKYFTDNGLIFIPADREGGPGIRFRDG